MPIRQKIVFLAITIALIVVIIELVRRRRLRVEYSWIWLVAAGSILALIFRYDLLIALTTAVGAVVPTSTLFFLCILFLALLSLHYSVRLTTLTREVKELTQELALARAEWGSSLNGPKKAAPGGTAADERRTG